MPMGEYTDFADCVAKNKNKKDPQAYCGAIKRTIEKDESGSGVGVQMEGIDDAKIEEALVFLEQIDNDKENNLITQEQHDQESKEVLEELEKTKVVQSEIKKPEPIKKYMKTTAGKRRVTMTRADGVKQHYWMNPEDIAKYKAKGYDVQEVPEGGEDKDKTVAIDFDGTIVSIDNPDQLQEGAKEGMQKIADMGYTIIIFSGRGTKDLEARLAKLGIDTYDYINDNPEERQDNPGKVVADKYLDDKAIKFTNWQEAISNLSGDEKMQKQIDPTLESQEEMDEASEEVPQTAPRAPVAPTEEKIQKEAKPVPREIPGSSAPKTRSYLKERGLLKEGLPNASAGQVNPKAVDLRGPKTGTPPTSEMDLPSERLSESDTSHEVPVEEYPYLEGHLKEAMGILDKCPKTKELGKEQKIQILQDTINRINPNNKEEEMSNVKKEDSPVAPAAPAPKDPLAEIKEMLAGLCHKVEAIEGQMSKYDPSYGRGVDGKGEAPQTQETQVQRPEQEGAVVEKNPLKPADVVNKEDESKEGEGKIEKAEPVKTLPVFQGQKKQAEKELGPDKVSGAQYLNKEDIAEIVEKAIGSYIQKAGFTETPKAKSPIEHPLEKTDVGEKFDMASLGTMSFEKINSIATKLQGGPRIG